MQSPDITDMAPLSEPRRPGRPKRNPNPPQTTVTPPNVAVNSPDVNEGTSDGSSTQLQPLKRGRGRPKRNVEIIQTQSSPSPSNVSISPSEQQPKRRGRKPKALMNLASQDSEPVPSSEDTSMETAADASETLTTEVNKVGGSDRICSSVTPMETDFLPQVSSVSSLFSSVMKSEQPFGSGGGIPGLDLDECEANVTPISTGTPSSHILHFGFGTSTASASSVADDDYKGTLMFQAPVVKTELIPKPTEEGDKETQMDNVKKEDASNEENESSKVRRSSRIKTLEEQRGSRGRRREVVSSLADTSGLSRSSVSLQEDDSNSSSSMQMYGGSSSGYSSPTREAGIGGLLSSSSSVPNLSSLSLTSSGSNNGTKPLKVKSRWRNSLDAESMKSFNMSAESISGTITDSVAAMKISVTSFIPEEQVVRRRGHLVFDGTDDELLEKLKKFDGIDESIFRTERKISKENKGMLCDCYLSNEDVLRGEVGCSEDCLNRLLMVECGNKCPTGENCSNKRFQKKEYSSLEVFKTEKKGHGLRTLQYIPEGGFVIEYVGEVLDVPEFERRTSEYAKGNQEHFYFMALKSDAIIDATLRGNCSRFINHSCEPNCETQKWTVNGEVRIGFFAIEDLQPGDEITFDYQFQRYGKKAQKCFCMTESCRGWLGEEDEDTEVPEEEKEETAAEVEMEVEDSKVKPKPKVDKKKRKNVQLEDMGFREELGKLETSGLKNRNHTLTLNRLMVRAEGWDDRERLLKILIKGDTPCRRLFLDYHGLRLIWSWMIDLPLPQESDGPQLIRNDVYHMLFLHALQSLPIPNKNLLLESKVLQLVEKWCSVPSVTTTVTLVKRPDVQQPEASVTPTATDVLTSVESGVEKMDISELKEEPTSTAEGMQEVSEEKSWDFVPFSKSLLESWSDLKEVFRIPKKERVEQMKEHEREADKGLLNALNQPSSNSSYDRDHRNKQFRNRGERRVPVLDSSQPQFHRYPSNRMALPPGVTKEEFRLRFEQSVRQQEEQELLRKQQDALVNLHQERCALVGLDPATTPIVDPHGIHYLDPKSVMWKPINIEDPMLPPELVKFVQLSQYPPVETTEPPAETPVEPEQAFPPWPPGLPPPPPLPPRELPTNWNMAVDDEGRCYYYHTRTRVTRWDPPTVDDLTESESSGCSSEEEVEEDEKGSPSLTKASIQTWHTKIIERTARRKKSGLVEERIISPRGDDEKGFSKEMVKENKKKVLEEKKLAMKEANNANKSANAIEAEEVAAAISDEIPISDVPNEGLQTSSEKKSTSPVKKRRKDKPTSSKGASPRKHKQKPIASIPTAEENLVSSSPIETELDLTLSQQSLDEESDGFFSRVSAGPSIISSTASMDVVKIPGLGFDSRDLDARKKADKVARHAAKKKALAMHKKIKEKAEAGSSSDKKLSSKEANSIKDSFRNSIATVVVAHLNPYRKSEHIKNTDDFKHLARKITHAILLKELKHTRDVTSLEVTDSVKHKTKEYIRKFMARFPNGVYIRSPENPQP